MLFSVSQPGEKFQNLMDSSTLRLPYGNLSTWRSQLLRSKDHKRIVSRYLAGDCKIGFHDVLVLGISMFPLKCVNVNCKNGATEGAHVEFFDQRRKGTFIVPLCQSCNCTQAVMTFYSSTPMLRVMGDDLHQGRIHHDRALPHVRATIHFLHDTVKVSIPTVSKD